MEHSLSKNPIELIKKTIKSIETEGREKISADDLKKRVQFLMNGYSCLTRIISSPLAWRARRNKENEHFSHIRELWYPQPEYIKTYGRLNRPGCPIMYLAASHHTAILELRPNVGDILTVLQLRLRDSNVLPHVVEVGVAEKSSQFGIRSTVQLLENTPTGRSFLKGNEDKNLAIRSFLAREFTRPVPRDQENLFKLSVAISEILMDSQRIDGVEYPSMAGTPDQFSGGANMALKTDSADRLYIADTCWIAEVIDKVKSPTEGFLIRCVKRAQRIAPDGTINW